MFGKTINTANFRTIGTPPLNSATKWQASTVAANFYMIGNPKSVHGIPTAPIIGNATANGMIVSVYFIPPANSVVTKYTVTSSPGGITATGFTSPIKVTGLTKGVSYTFTVYATNSSGNGPSSNPTNQVVPNPNFYYFSISMGNDNNTAKQAQNPLTPWKTINKLNGVMRNLLPGDEVLFNRGDTFSGTVNIKVSGALNNPITFSTYGTGNKPMFDNRISLTNWTQVGSNLWEATHPLLNAMPFALFINDSLKPLGRYPRNTAANGGFLNTDALHNVISPNSNKEFTCHSLPANLDFTGAEAIVRSDAWVLDHLPGVVEVGDTTIKFASPNTKTSHALKPWRGFFFQNHPSCLSSDGDWCYRWHPSDSIMLYSIANPNNRNIKVSNTANEFAFTDTNYSYISISGLYFMGTDSAAVILKNANYVTISNCDFRKAGLNDILANNCDSLSINNNTIAHSQGRSIVANACTHVSIIGNILDSIGMVAGMDLETQSNLYSYLGMYVGRTGKFTCNCLIQDNSINGTGYDGIYFQGSNVTINHNFISNFCSVIDDGGGIYTFTNNTDSVANRFITNNIVMNGIGNTYGFTTDTTYKPAHGIDWDAFSPYVTVTGNTVANCAGSGLTWGFSANTLKNNTVYNCGKTGLSLGEGQPNYTGDQTLKNLPNYSTANDIENNLFVSTKKHIGNANTSGFLGRYSIDTAAKAGYGKLGIVNNNIYCNPFLQNSVFNIIGEYTDTSGFCSLSEWQALTGYDSNSTGSPVSYPLYNNLIGSNLVSNGLFNSNTSGWSTSGSTGSSLTISTVAGKLDGNCLKVKLSGSNSQSSSNVYFNLPTLTAGKTYLLRFSALGTLIGAPSGFITVRVKNAFANMMYINLSNSRTEQQILFTPTTSTSANVAQLIFGSKNFNGTYYLDNISLYEVNPTQDSNYIRFAYNPTHIDSNIIADKNYITPAGVRYRLGSAVPLPSFGSVVLLKDTTIILPISSLEIYATNSKEGVKVEWNIAYQKNSIHYLIERSTDGNSFIVIDSLKANDSGTYEYLDSQLPKDGNNLYYRIKEVTETGLVNYSNVAKLITNYESGIKLYPNPLKGKVLSMWLNGVAEGKYVVSLYNSIGEKVSEQLFSHSGGISSHAFTIGNNLAAGIYNVVIKNVGSGQVVSRKRLVVSYEL